MTDWDFDTHRARMRRDARIHRRIGYTIMAVAACMILGFVSAVLYFASTTSLDDVARKAGELARTFEDAAQ